MWDRSGSAVVGHALQESAVLTTRQPRLAVPGVAPVLLAETVDQAGTMCVDGFHREHHEPAGHELVLIDAQSASTSDGAFVLGAVTPREVVIAEAEVRRFDEPAVRPTMLGVCVGLGGSVRDELFGLFTAVQHHGHDSLADRQAGVDVGWVQQNAGEWPFAARNVDEPLIDPGAERLERPFGRVCEYPQEISLRRLATTDS